ncbi:MULTISPECIES: UDP-2,4-diacetamido-2,4,6-trideoxy-beta-L-altropyranose hydrolase [Pseudomonas aeruginosa group]|uniref:UDP-2,4-diacetamido-2,4, 6-trideoxy-beta-L-altropyranose hydrolase n=1 Tax=Pseudomonas aeruginosa group TaxID=136841 RepID=UPI0008FB7366|nr:UDP-2,4-diacetamido-2,4,6-trideoxy-beta-L-altropyranose hydrolase [Pseudomonas aeruginosa]OPE35140.1 UDP-2,4-diacetamido-2,4,6-trideoxy-beta-L-altropyranose hydrolase [Pseudomonas aeruginosa]RPV07653.1 UDP-2,4-diacetamido-2,4,6-trideoxy-beta-L-altropyranose hydrolase [Pseudomonas aeruginosa]
MRAVFRADASLQIGTGHVMRCLSMAREIAVRGGECIFICREHKGHLIRQIQGLGFKVHTLPLEACLDSDTALPHARWLGSTQAKDAALCVEILKHIDAEWMVVDHYALDEQWEAFIKPLVRNLFVIDDLTDRKHDCNILLNQNLAVEPNGYAMLVPTDARILCGPAYALLRPEFHAARQESIKARQGRPLKHILVSLGGIDKDNITLRAIDAIKSLDGCQYFDLTVVMGPNAPWKNSVHSALKSFPGRAELRIGVSNMAELMVASDVAIGAAGSTSWERCVLGLPTLILILADNQLSIGRALQAEGAAQVIELEGLEHELPRQLALLMSRNEIREAMSQAASYVCDGLGVQRVVDHIYE